GEQHLAVATPEPLYRGAVAGTGRGGRLRNFAGDRREHRVVGRAGAARRTLGRVADALVIRAGVGVVVRAVVVVAGVVIARPVCVSVLARVVVTGRGAGIDVAPAVRVPLGHEHRVARPVRDLRNRQTLIVNAKVHQVAAVTVIGAREG